MSKTLTELAQQLKSATHNRKAVAEKISDVKVQLIYAFNGTGKTRLSREFKDLIAPKNDDEGTADLDQSELTQKTSFITVHLPKIYFIGITIWIMMRKEY